MYWQHKENNDKQILISRCKFLDGKYISLPWENFSLETCPIPIEEFEDYLDFPYGISNEGFDKIKEYLAHQGAHEFICFTGIK
ncbi:MAG: hypothetical protein PHR61_04355 [Candidatus Absconditabacteria bacterium]|nr:hypothetical protein [Candidatus Absconditabacteria bacterium]